MSEFHLKGLLRNDGELVRALRALPVRVPPPGLTTSLRILASRERQRAVQRRTLQKFLESCADRFNLTMHNLMRPFALPVAGGVFSAVALFSMFVAPAYPVRAMAGARGLDVPTALTTVAKVKGTAGIGIASADVVVEIDIDGRGRMVAYRILHGQEMLRTPSQRRSLENQLIFTQFEPATAFGVPTRGTITLYLNYNRIDVKG
jgi:hypothetical protein